MTTEPEALERLVKRALLYTPVACSTGGSRVLTETERVRVAMALAPVVARWTEARIHDERERIIGGVLRIFGFKHPELELGNQVLDLVRGET